MLKFLRKNQKWMLVIFCAVLMVAFLIPQAVSQFAPNMGNPVVATLYDGQEIRRDQIVRASSDLETLRRLRIEPLEFEDFGLTLLPRSDSERDDALSWIMIQSAAERNGLGASRQDSFDVVTTVLRLQNQLQGLPELGIQDSESLNEYAKELGVNGEYLLEVGRQYLVAAQYRQLVSGIEYQLPDDERKIGSPGVRRVIAMYEAVSEIRAQLQQYAQLAQSNPQVMQQLMSVAVQNVLVNQGYLDKIQGHERFSATELRYALQREFAEIDLTVVVLDAKDQLGTTIIDDAYIQKIFDQFADDRPGTGQPYGVGYREPDKVQLEAIRIPVDALRDKVAETITPEDVRKYYNDNRGVLIDTSEPGEGEEPSFGPAKLTAELRDKIRLTLTQVQAEQKAVEIAQKARQRLNEDARGLADDGIYKVLPDDFTPTPLTQIAAEIEEEHGIVPEIILIDDFVSADEIVATAQFTQAWLSKVPTSTVQLPGFGLPQQIPETVLGGRAGLFSSFVPELSSPQRLARLADYILITQAFLSDERKEQAARALQAGLPGMLLADPTRSTYVFRVTKAQPSRPAPELAPIADEVREDAKLIKAYEDLVDEEETLLQRAAATSIEALMPNADAKSTLSGLTRGQANQRFGASIDGVGSTQPIIQRAFQVTDDLIASGSFDDAEESERLFAVELPGDYKLAIVRVDTFRPMTRSTFEEQARRPESLMLATTLGATEPLDPPLSFEALQRYTGFAWGENYGPEEEGEEGELSEEDAEQSSPDSEETE